MFRTLACQTALLLPNPHLSDCPPVAEPSPVRLPACHEAPLPVPRLYLFVALSEFPNNLLSVSGSLFVEHLVPLALLPQNKFLCSNNQCILEYAQ